MAKKPAFGLLPFDRGVAMLGISVPTARRLLRDPRCDFPRPSVKIGRKKFYRNQREILDWLDRKPQ